MQHVNKKLPGKELRHYKILEIYGLVHYTLARVVAREARPSRGVWGHAPPEFF